MVRVPNILHFQPRPFDPDNYEKEDDLVADEDEGKGRAENVVRWREGDRPQSNTRIVTWSDGSTTLHVGAEILVAQQVAIPEGSTHLYTRHKGSNLECHGELKQKLVLAPASRHSKTHQSLTQKIAR
jgi:RNA polymerase-associated protein LEO1